MYTYQYQYWPYYYCGDYYETCPHCNGNGYRIRRPRVSSPVIIERERIIIREDKRRWR